MSIITYPGTRVASFRWRKVNQAITSSGPFGGTQSLESGAPVWAADLTGVSEDRVTARRFEVFVESLDGFRNQLELWNMENPVPAGTLRGTGVPFTLAANAAQGATSMQLVAGTSNLLTFPEAFDNAAWEKGGLTISANNVTAPDGTLTADKLVSTVADAYAAMTKSALAATQYVFSIYLRADAPTSVELHLIDGGGGTGRTFVNMDVTTAWQRFSVVRTTSAGTTLTLSQIGGNSSFSIGKLVYAWGAKLEQGSVPTDYGFGKTLLQGDLLGIGSGLTQQVARIANDAISTGQGLITVNIGTPLRNAFTAGMEVRFDKPKALFRQRTLYEGNEYTADGAKPWMLSLVEDWRP